MHRRTEDTGPLYTLTQIAERSGIHRMLLESYLHSAAWRVPTVWVEGEERYPSQALVAFREMHEEAQRASAPAVEQPAPDGDGPHWARRRLLSLTAQLRNASGRGRSGSQDPSAGDRTSDAPRPPERQQPPAVGARRASDASATRDSEPAAPAPPPRPAPPDTERPAARRLYTLQQVHEHTTIPYPVLALYAASESSRIPAAGERYAALYPWEAMAAFCRIHREKNPSWQPPDLPAAPPSAADEEQARQLSARLERLERAQAELSEQIRSLLDEDERFLPVTVAPARPGN
jgi:hypothetical protein